MYFVLVCDFLRTPHMYFRLQPVFSVSLCSVGFANVDDFLRKYVYKNGHNLRVLQL